MKIRIKLSNIFILILVAAAAAAVIISMQKFDIRIFSREKISRAEAVLIRINEIYSISSVEYIYKTVFPFDFYDENLNWYLLLDKRNRGAALTEKEAGFLKLYDLCRDTGIHLEKPNYQFIVITSLVKAGISSAELIGKDNIRIEGSRISIRLPESTITEFIIEDNDSSSYNYPDMEIDPLHWKLITDLVRPEIRKRVLDAGILEEASRRLENFLSSFLYEAGFESVEFIRE